MIVTPLRRARSELAGVTPRRLWAATIIFAALATNFLADDEEPKAAALPELRLRIVEFAREHGRVTVDQTIEPRTRALDSPLMRGTIRPHFGPCSARAVNGLSGGEGPNPFR